MADHYVDLHVHSSASDGTDDPSALPKVMVRSRVGVAALTDHDTVGGLLPFLDACRAADVRGIPGLEVSACCDSGHLHLLLLGFEPTDPDIGVLVDWIGDARLRRNVAMLKNLRRLGVDLSWSQVEAEAGEYSMGRPHFVSALMNGGWIKSRNEAFERYIGDDCPAYVPRDKPVPEEVISVAHKADAVVIVAHPISAVNRDIDLLLPYLETLREMGADGVEAYHPSQASEVGNTLRRWAVQRQLYCSGGSDYHGANKPGVSMGRWGRRRMPVMPQIPLLERLGAADAVLAYSQASSRPIAQK